MLKIKLFKGFVILVVLSGLLFTFLGIQIIRNRVIGEAQTRVEMDLNSAWAVFNGKQDEISTVLRLAASKEAVVDVCRDAEWDDGDVRMRLDRIRVNFGLDFLDLLSADGQVKLRTTPPYRAGDYRLSDPAVRSALAGEAKSCIAVLSQAELQQEAVGLAERAFLEVENTPKARRSQKREEGRGMVMVGAVPVEWGGRVCGVIYGGVLLNRNYALVDRVHDVVYMNQTYGGRPFGTATIFLGDTRVATTVRQGNGNRALGTRVSKEVADRVLDNGQPWIGEAFVVRDWYLTAYDPIRDGFGDVVGMLYVGILKQKYVDAMRAVIMRYLYVSLFVLLVALVLAFIIAGRLSQPIHRLVEAANHMRHGERPPPVPTDNACSETEALIVAFNQMAEALTERETRLKALNRSYMETLGFVSHELKSPVATIMNYVYLLRERKLGPVTEKQLKAVRAIDAGSQRLVEMVRHYLNLSRIENRELEPVRTRVHVLDEVLAPLLEQAEAQIGERAMVVENRVERAVQVHADMNMMREVFENLISNAVKYGRDGGRIELRAAPAGDQYEFAVRNEGEGIPEDRLGDMFQKFSRIEDSKAARRQKGTGLGLFITKHIVEAHGGSIGVKSAAGSWAEFTFTLPAYKDEESRQDDATVG